MSTSLIEKDMQNVWHPFTQVALDGSPVFIERASGALLFTDDNQELIDAISSWWVCLHGHTVDAVTEAIQAQLKTLHHVVFAGCTHRPAIELSTSLLSLLPDTFQKVFFTDNGSSAVEAALKMIIQYWQQIGEPHRKRFLSLEGGYHGDTVGAMSVGGKSFFSKPFEDYLFETHPLEWTDQSVEGVLTSLNKEIAHGDVAAFVYEPLLQGAAGMRHVPHELLDAILQTCRNANVLLVADEVFTGFWKTGTCFASEQCSVWPDIIVLSKALTAGTLPLAVTITTEKIFEAFRAPSREKMLLHGHTFTANPLGCAAASASLALMKKPDFAKNVSRICQFYEDQRERFCELSNAENVRVMGLVFAFEIRVNEAASSGAASYTQPIRDVVFQYCLQRGVFLRPLGSTVYVLPPVVISDSELQRLFDVLYECLIEIG